MSVHLHIYFQKMYLSVLKPFNFDDISIFCTGYVLFSKNSNFNESNSERVVLKIFFFHALDVFFLR